MRGNNSHWQNSLEICSGCTFNFVFKPQQNTSQKVLIKKFNEFLKTAKGAVSCNPNRQYTILQITDLQKYEDCYRKVLSLKSMQVIRSRTEKEKKVKDVK